MWAVPSSVVVVAVAFAAVVVKSIQPVPVVSNTDGHEFGFVALQMGPQATGQFATLSLVCCVPATIVVVPTLADDSCWLAQIVADRLLLPVVVDRWLASWQEQSDWLVGQVVVVVQQSTTAFVVVVVVGLLLVLLVVAVVAVPADGNTPLVAIEGESLDRRCLDVVAAVVVVAALLLDDIVQLFGRRADNIAVAVAVALRLRLAVVAVDEQQVAMALMMVVQLLGLVVALHCLVEWQLQLAPVVVGACVVVEQIFR